MSTYVSGFELLCGMKTEIMDSTACTALADFSVRWCMTTPLQQVCTGLGIFSLRLLWNLLAYKCMERIFPGILILTYNYVFPFNWVSAQLLFLFWIVKEENITLRLL